MFAPQIVFRPDFRIETTLTPAELSVYRARAQACQSRFKWSEKLKPLWDAFLIHNSANVPGKVAYFANVANMLENRLTRTSPEMFYQRALALAPPNLRDSWSEEVLGVKPPELKFISNDDPDGWERIYFEGPRSCMKGSALVRCYAHPANHLALAYLQIDGQIKYRAICNTATMKYVRAYGPDDEMHVFINALNQAGYYLNRNALCDEVIYVSPEKCSCCGDWNLIAPYLDGNHQYLELRSSPSLIPEAIIGDLGDEPTYNRNEPKCGCFPDQDTDYGDDDDDE